jgi:hypothetical protein
MATKRPITDADYAHLAQLHGQGLTRNQIAKAMDRGTATVSRLAAKLGLDFDRTRTAVGTAAKVLDAKARRADLALKLLEDAEQLRERMHASYTVWRILNDGELVTGQLARPDARDQRDLMIAASTAIEKSLRLDEYDRENGNEDGKSMLVDLHELLRQAFAGRTSTT